MVQNVLFENFHVIGPSIAAAISQSSGNNGSYAGTSLMQISNIAFVNFTGYSNSAKTSASVSCSNVYPCYNIAFEDWEVAGTINGTARNATGTCTYNVKGGISGLTGCT